MLSEAEKKAWNELDDIAAKYGGYVDYNPDRPIIIEADYRAMSKYCREKGIDPMSLSDEEYAVFLYKEPLIYGN